MKKILLAMVGALALASCDKKESAVEAGTLQIRGHIKHADTGYVVLKEAGDIAAVPIDSVKAADGNFKFKIKPKEKTFYFVDIYKKQTLFLIGGPDDTLFVEADGDSQQGKYLIKGSKDNDQIKQASDLINGYHEEFNKQQQAYMALLQQGKSEEAQAIVAQIDASYERKISEAKALANSFNPLPAMSLAANFISPQRDLPFLDSLSQKIKKELPASKHTKSFVEFVDRNKVLNVGAPAPDFSARTPEGKWVKLSDFKGKYVLLDFWASWCKPCRQENPNVVRTYNAYKDKNFAILSFSLDQDKNDWVEAIKKDGLTWTHVSELKGWESSVSQSYKVEGIPATFLIDKEGKIIGRDLRGEALEEKLKEVLK